VKKPATKKSRHKSRSLTLKIAGKQKIAPMPQALEILDKQIGHQQWSAAADLSRQIIGQVPGSNEARIALYRALAETRQFPQLEQLCRDHLKGQPRHSISLEYMAFSLRQQGREAEALPYLVQAVAVETTNSRLVNVLGTLYKELGEFAKAKDCFDKALALKPLSGKTWWNRSDLSQTPQQDTTDLEKQLRRLPSNSRQKHYFHFALYRAYDALGEFEQAFEHLQKGNAAKADLLDYNLAGELAQDDQLVAFFEANYQKLKTSLESTSLSDFSPLFIVGMPRSGTSLVEQILAAHSQVRGCGELSALPQATSEILNIFAKGAAFPECLATIPAHGLAQIGHRYQQLTANFLEGKATTTDKFLLNYKAVPLISLVLPKARIIHLQRNGMDVCFGCYRQLFDQGLGFTYDLRDMAKTYGQQKTMAKRWKSLINEGYYWLDYEQLVADPVQEIKQLLAFCGLNDEESCYQFHQSTQTVKTISSTQVRQPIFNSGLGRWKPYAQWLQPLMDSLEEIEKD